MSTAEFGDPNLAPAPATPPAPDGLLTPLTISAPGPVSPEPLLTTAPLAPAAPSQAATPASAAAIRVQDMRDVPLGTLIFREGLLTEEQLQEALQDGMQRGKRLGEVLLERGLVSEQNLGRLLAAQKGLPFVELDAAVIDPAAVQLLPAEKARLHTVLPIGFQDGLPVVAVADPSNDLVVENVRRALSCEPHLVVAGREALHRQIEVAYAEPVPAVTPTPVLEQQPTPVAVEPVAPAPAAPAPEFTVAVEPQPAAPVAAPVAAFEPAPVAPVAAEPASASTDGVWLTPPATVAEPASVAAQPLVVEPHAPAAEAVPTQPFAAEPAPTPPVEPLSILNTPVEPAAEPAAVEPAPAVEPLVLAEPLVVAEPVVVADPPAAPEPVVHAQPVTPEPVPVDPPAPVQPVGETLTFAEGGATETFEESETTYSIVVRLVDGDRMELGAFSSAEEARAHAEQIVRQLTGGSSWPFLQGRFIRPEAIVSVDLQAPERTWLGSAARRAAWQRDARS